MNVDQYKLLHARHLQLDTLVWQTPSLASAALSFLLLTAFSDRTEDWVKFATSSLSLCVAVAAIQLMSRHRHHEIEIRGWLRDFEVSTQGFSVLHTRETMITRRKPQLLAAWRSFWVWTVVLSAFAALGLAGMISAAREMQWIVVMPHFQFDGTVTVGDFLVAAGFLASVAAVYQVSRSIRQANRALTSTHYSELDRLYGELLTHVIEHPYLRSPEPLETDATALHGEYTPLPQKQENRLESYNAYAHKVWCFIETLHDRCVETLDDKEREDFRRTWATAIDVEDRLHRGWFLNEMHEEAKRSRLSSAETGVSIGVKFRREFQVFVVERQWREPDWTYRENFRKAVDYGVTSADEGKSG